MDCYEKAARGPKEVEWCDTGHDLDDPQALADRLAWLRKKIGLAKVELVGKKSGGKD